VAVESGGGQKFLPPIPFLFARPSVLVLRAKRTIILGFTQKMFEHRPKNTAFVYLNGSTAPPVEPFILSPTFQLLLNN
jgi:hypothetical protein